MTGRKMRGMLMVTLIRNQKAKEVNPRESDAKRRKPRERTKKRMMSTSSKKHSESLNSKHKET